MSLIAGYENDIFISYAHNDNLPVHSTRWVEVLHRELENRLTQLLGTRPLIWRDPRMDGTELIEGTLDSNISNSAILLAILSPSYVGSKWCKREREEFCRGAKLKGGLRVENRFRIVKVGKTFVPRDKHPDELRKTLGFDFFREDRASGDSVELKPGSDEFGDKLEELAVGLRRLVESLAQKRPSELAIARRVVYIAEPSSDLRAERESIRFEFEQNGHQVLPREELPRKLNARDLESLIRESLMSSTLSVHLLGSRFGFVPEGGSRSIVELQHDLALERRDDGGFKRIIWIPKGLEDSDETEEAQKQFIKRLLKDSAAQAGAELTRDKIEDVKTIIYAALKPAPDPIAKFDSTRSLASVYLMCHESDYEETGPLVDCLTEQRCEVLPPLLEHDKALVSQYHREALLESDALMIYYNNASDSWAQIRRLELLKLPGLGRSKPAIAKAFYISGEVTPQKERFRSNEALVIKHYGGFSADSVAPFVAEITKAKGSPR